MQSKNIFIFFILTVVFSGPLAAPATAQKCDPDYEVIIKLRKPEIGSYNLWDAIYGEKTKTERFASGVTNAAGNVVVAGERSPHEGGERVIILAEFDRRGRVVWERESQIKNLEKITVFLRSESGYIVVADRKEGERKHQIWLGFFDQAGALVKEKTIRDKDFDLFSHDMIISNEGKGYLLAASARGRGYESLSYAILYKLNSRGHVTSDKAYLPGLENRILGLAPQDGKFYIATGYTRMDDGRKAGWALKLNEKGAILWQRQYPRGLSAKIKASADYTYTKPYFVAVGDAEPSDRKNKAGWVMMLNGDNGDIGWQRYYTGDFDFHGRDILTHSDGQISVLLDGENPPRQDNLEYARVLTLSPRGVVLLSDTYFNGKGAGAYRMFLGPNQERILAGHSDVLYQVENMDDPQGEAYVENSREGWVVAGSPAEPYDDPCVQPYSFIP